MRQNKRLLISIKEARKILGKPSENLSNEEVELLIQYTELLSRFTIHQYLVRKAEVVK